MESRKSSRDVYSFLRGETGQVVLKVNVHFIEDAEMDDAGIRQ